MGPAVPVGPHTPEGTVEIATTMIRVSTVSVVALFSTIVRRVLPVNVATTVGVVAILPVVTGGPVERNLPPKGLCGCRTRVAKHVLMSGAQSEPAVFPARIGSADRNNRDPFDGRRGRSWGVSAETRTG